ncbi:MAG: sigma-70 family RNA polymerase sigma factor [Prevotella sp.]|jgi:RNA polymerase sigma-70 factor (ECF subfamily)|nr:sigma-70 family RNA polymerase sigma factor [Prevotella sp.]
MTGKTIIEQLFIGCRQRMLAVARLMLKNDDDANDAVSDVFFKLTEGSLRVPADHPENYLMATVRNLCLDRIRLMTLHERLERRITLSDNDQAYGESERERIAEMIDYAERTFSKQTWRVFQLRFDEGLLYREIAERLGISEVAVYKHLAEALKKLKEKYNPTRR